MKVLLRAPFSPFTGYGNDGIGLARAMIRWGLDVRLQPIHVDAPLPEGVARLLTKPLDAPFDLMVVHLDPLMLGVPPEARRAVQDGLVVGWTMWEYESFEHIYAMRDHGTADVSNEWLRGLGTWDERYGALDAVACYSDVTKTALDREVAGMTTFVQQGGYQAEDWDYIDRDWFGERFAYCMLGMLGPRKDPFVAIRAFKALKEEHPEFESAELHLKTQSPGLHPKLEEMVPKLRIHYDVWPEDIVKQFYGEMHVLLAPSHGEGKNVPALEAMSTGMPVIATNWAGHTQWLSNDWAYPLDYEMGAEPGAPTARSARASEEHLKQLMFDAFARRATAKRKGELASQMIPQLCSWDAVLERFFRKLAETVPGRGERLCDLAMRDRRQAAFDTTRQPRVEMFT